MMSNRQLFYLNKWGDKTACNFDAKNDGCDGGVVDTKLSTLIDVDVEKKKFFVSHFKAELTHLIFKEGFLT